MSSWPPQAQTFHRTVLIPQQLPETNGRPSQIEGVNKKCIQAWLTGIKPDQTDKLPLRLLVGELLTPSGII